MTQTDATGFSCSACGRQFRWKPELAGKSVKCKCGQPIRVPRQSGGASNPAPASPKVVAPPPPPKPADDDLDGLYALAGDAERASADESSSRGANCPSCRQTLAPGAVLCTQCGTDLRTGKRFVAPAMPVVEGMPAAAGAGVIPLPYRSAPVPGRGAPKEESVYFEGGKFRSLYLPLILLGVGFILTIIHGYVSAGIVGVAALGIFVAFSAILDAALLLVALFLAVKFFDMGFGALGPALLKVFTIAIGPGAVAGMAAHAVGGGLNGFMVSALVGMILYYALISILFQLDLGETITLVGLIYVIENYVKPFLLLAILAGVLGAGALGRAASGDSSGAADDGSGPGIGIVSDDSDDSDEDTAASDDDMSDEETPAAPTPAPKATPSKPAPAPSSDGL